MEKITFTNGCGKEVTVKIGDSIFFKSDVEQSAEVIEIQVNRNNPWSEGYIFIVKAPADGFSGHYIGRQDTAEVYSEDIF